MPNLSEDFMFQFRDDGVILNAEPDGGAFIDIIRVAGLDNAPVRTTVREREGMDGGFVDAEYESARTVIIEGTVYGEEANVEFFLDQLKVNYAPTSEVQPFYFSLTGAGVRTLFCKSGGVSYDITTLRRTGQVNVLFTLYAEDPSIYADEITASITLDNGLASGRGYNKSYNYGYGGSGQHGPSVTIINTGNRPASADIIIHGAILAPSVYHEQTGKLLWCSQIQLTESDELVINLRNRTVRLNGVNRRRALSGSDPWFLLAPGPNTFRFSGVPLSVVPPTLTITLRPAYR